MITKIETPFDSELQEQEIYIPEGFEASIENGKIILRKIESGDEMTKNEIIAFVEQAIHRGGGTPVPQEMENRWIAWLEKQGQSKKTSIIAIDKATNALIEKACEWLLNHNYYLENPYANVISFNMAKLVADFRKAMKKE